MIYTLQLEVKGTAALGKKQINDAFKGAMNDTGLEWWKEFLPKHFGPHATQRYGYMPRKGSRFAHGNKSRGHRGSYSERKLRAVGHTRPLEYSGEGKRQALSSPKIYATRNKVVVRLPRKFNLRNPKSQINMADELRAVRPDERRHLARVHKSGVRQRLRKAGAKRATVTGSISAG